MASEDTMPAAPRSAMMEAFCNARGPGWGRGAIGRHPSFKLVKPSDVGTLKPSLLPQSPITLQNELMQPQSQTPQTSAAVTGSSYPVVVPGCLQPGAAALTDLGHGSGLSQSVKGGTFPCSQGQR